MSRKLTRAEKIERVCARMVELYEYDIDACLATKRGKTFGCRRCRAADAARKALALPHD